MKVIVPAKVNSERVPNKNFRPFHGDKNLVDVTLENFDGMMPYVTRRDIVLSTSDVADVQEYRDRGYGIHFRSETSTLNHTPIRDVLKELSDEILDDTDDEVAFAMVCDPLFTRHRDVFDVWDRVMYHGYDSIGVVVPQKEYLLDSEMKPEGFGFGRDHRPSQDLPTRYRLNFCFSIVKRDAFQRDPYHVGKKPFWYVYDGPSVDIDTMQDFKVAQHLYEDIHG